MEAPPSAKPKRGSPPIPPNYVSLRQLQELRLKEKEEQEKRQREEAEPTAAAAAAAMAKREEAARKAEIEAIAPAKRDAARKPEARVSAVVPVAHARAKERRDGGPGAQWVAVAHRPAAPPPARRDAVREAIPIGSEFDNKGPADGPRGGGTSEGKPKGEEKERVSASAIAPTRTADDPGKAAEDSSRGGRPGSKGGRKGKGKAKEDEVSGETGAEPDSVAGSGSGESAGAPYRRRRNPKWKKGAGGRNAAPSAESGPEKTAGASPPEGVKPENTGNPKSSGAKRADASPSSDSSRGKKADAIPSPPVSGVVGVITETKPKGVVEERRRLPAVEVQGAAEQKPRVVSRSRRAWPRPAGDWCNGAGEQQHGRVWVPKAAADYGDR